MGRRDVNHASTCVISWFERVRSGRAGGSPSTVRPENAPRCTDARAHFWTAGDERTPRQGRARTCSVRLMTRILHLTEFARWRAGGDAEAESLAAEGFLHASPDEPTMLAVANRFYTRTAEPMVVLVVDTDRLEAEVRWEAAAPAPPPGVGAEVLFPHVYGPIPRTAVIEVLHPVRDDRGTYTALERLPEQA